MVSVLAHRLEGKKRRARGGACFTERRMKVDTSLEEVREDSMSSRPFKALGRKR